MEGLNGDTPSFPFGPQREATITIIVFSSPATLTGAEEKKTGPSRFRPDFWKKFYPRITFARIGHAFI
jgi:hypothetical protein